MTDIEEEKIYATADEPGVVGTLLVCSKTRGVMSFLDWDGALCSKCFTKHPYDDTVKINPAGYLTLAWVGKREDR